MAIDPGSASLIRGGLKAANIAIEKTRHALLRRRPEGSAPERLEGIKALVQEAIDDLLGDYGAIEVVRAIDAAIGRPASMKKPCVQEWLRRSTVQGAIVDYFQHDFSGQSTDRPLLTLAEEYELACGEIWQLGVGVFDEILDFTARTIVRSTKTDAQALNIDLTRNLGQSLHKRADHIEKAVDGLQQRYELRVRPDLVDREIDEALQRIKARRGFTEVDQVAEVRSLADQLRGDGALSGGTSKTVATALIYCARVLLGDDKSHIAEAEALVAVGKRIYPQVDTFIADVWLTARNQGSAAALRLLNHSGLSNVLGISLSLKRTIDGDDAARFWAAEVQLTPSDLDAIGLYNLFQLSWVSNDIERARSLLRQVTPEQQQELPVLHFIRTLIEFGGLFAVGFGMDVLTGIPFDPKRNLADLPGVSIRQNEVRKDLQDLASSLREYDLTVALRQTELTQTWLDLLREETIESASALVTARMEHETEAVHWCRLALPFGIAFNRSPLETFLSRSRAMGGWNADETVAAFMLAYHDPDPKAFLDFLAQNRSDVSAHIHPAVIVQSEVIKRLDVDDILGARTVLNDNRGALGEEIAGSLQARMDASESDNPLPLLEARYAETGAIDDLRYLVGISWSRKEYQRASKYARTWFEAAPTVRAAELLVNSLSKCGRGQEVLAFLEAHPHLVDLSAELLEARAWHRFYAGQMSSAEEDLARLKVSRDDFNDISLAVSISVETGDWARAMALVEEEYQKRSKVPLIRLHQAATLAVSIGSERASELIKSLADHDEATADTKAQAYFLATRMGLDQKAGEWKVLLASWLETAIAASKEGVGPLQEATFEDMIEFAKKDRERRSYLFERLSKGEAPLSIVAQALNASILHFFYYRSYR